jgi:hypothetical protein
MWVETVFSGIVRTFYLPDTTQFRALVTEDVLDPDKTHNHFPDSCLKISPTHIRNRQCDEKGLSYFIFDCRKIPFDELCSANSVANYAPSVVAILSCDLFAGLHQGFGAMEGIPI